MDTFYYDRAEIENEIDYVNRSIGDREEVIGLFTRDLSNADRDFTAANKAVRGLQLSLFITQAHGRTRESVKRSAPTQAQIHQILKDGGSYHDYRKSLQRSLDEAKSSLVDNKTRLEGLQKQLECCVDASSS